MTALTDFVVAAGSYFGLPEGRVMEGSTVETKDGEMELVLRIVLSSDDVVGIGKRMGVLLAQAESDARVEDMEPILPSREALRAQYNSLPASQRSAFGSFAKFKALYNDSGIVAVPPGADKVVELPPHVYVPGRELTAQQLSMAVGMDAEGRYAMDPNDLTPEQLAEWGPR